MGHLVNPVAWRLGKNIYWKSLYFVNNLDFASNNVNDINLFSFLNRFFNKKFLKFSNFSISNFKILKFFSGTFVYALFKSYNYSKGGLFKYSRNFFLNKLFRKKLFKKKPYSFIKKMKHFRPNKHRHVLNKPKRKLNILEFFLPKKRKAHAINFYDYRLETFKKIIKKKSRFISRKYGLYRKRRSYSKKKYFLNYCFYVNNFRTRFLYAHRREAEYYTVLKVMRGLKRIFSVKFSKKDADENFIFNNYFFNNPRDYFRKKSYFSRSKSKVRRSILAKKDYFDYNYRNFFIFNVLKLFPKFFLNFFTSYSGGYASDYVFVKNKSRFKLGFYNNFLHIYRKFPIFLFVKNFLSSFVNKFFYKVKFTFIFCSEKFISANLVKNFILSKISHKFRINKITFMVLRLLDVFHKKNIIKGFRILLAGRFSRKDRATFY